MVLASKHVPLAGGVAQRGEQNSVDCAQACPGPHASVVHCNAMVLKQAPLTGPWHAARHPWSVARHVAPLLRKPAAHCSQQSGSPAPVGQLCRHACPALSTSAKHVCALPLHGCGHVSPAARVAEQLVPQSAWAARHAVCAPRDVVMHPARHCAAVGSDPQPCKHAFAAVRACIAHTRWPLPQLL